MTAKWESLFKVVIETSNLHKGTCISGTTQRYCNGIHPQLQRADARDPSGLPQDAKPRRCEPTWCDEHRVTNVFSPRNVLQQTIEASSGTSASTSAHSGG
jgi:hypothetical protein